MYLGLKHLHIMFAVISVTGFVARGVLAVMDSPLLLRRWLRVLPHINDTLLFTAGIALAIMTRQTPFVDTWITLKLAAVLLYIGLGYLALRKTLPAGLRLASGFAALIVAAYIVLVAITKNPLPF